MLCLICTPDMDPRSLRLALRPRRPVNISPGSIPDVHITNAKRKYRKTLFINQHHHIMLYYRTNSS